MYEELVKRLRHCSEERSGCGTCELSDTCVLQTRLLLQAADAIEDLIAALTASNEVIAKSKSRWIPVTEQLPEEDKLVLVWRNNGLPYVSRRIDSSYWVGLGRDAGVTHWMPLPEPPKEET